MTVNDGNGNTSVFTYASNISTAANTTDIPFVGVNFAVTKTDPASNQTVYSFQGEYQTSAQYYQGSATGTPLQTVVTCYNGNTSSCAAQHPNFPADHANSQVHFFRFFQQRFGANQLRRLWERHQRN